MKRRTFLGSLLAAAFVGPALLARREQEVPKTTSTIDFHRSDFGMVEVRYGSWQAGKTRQAIVIDDYSRQMQRALTDINRVVNENLWNGGKLRA